MRTIGVPGHLFPSQADRLYIAAGHMGRLDEDWRPDVIGPLQQVGVQVSKGRWVMGSELVRLSVVDEFALTDGR